MCLLEHRECTFGSRHMGLTVVDPRDLTRVSELALTDVRGCKRLIAVRGTQRRVLLRQVLEVSTDRATARPTASRSDQSRFRCSCGHDPMDSPSFVRIDGKWWKISNKDGEPVLEALDEVLSELLERWSTGRLSTGEGTT